MPDGLDISWDKELQQRYQEETGEELPDHVVENIELLTRTDPGQMSNFVSSEELEEHLKRSHPQNTDDNQVLKGMSFILFWAGLSILAGVLGTQLFAGFWTAAFGGIAIALLTAAIIGAMGSWLF